MSQLPEISPPGPHVRVLDHSELRFILEEDDFSPRAKTDPSARLEEDDLSPRAKSGPSARNSNSKKLDGRSSHQPPNDPAIEHSLRRRFAMLANESRHSFDLRQARIWKSHVDSHNQRVTSAPGSGIIISGAGRRPKILDR